MSNTPENNKMFGVLVEKGSKNRKYAVFYPYKSIQEMLGTDRYDETKSYPQGTMVIYDKKLYKAVTNTTVGPWNPEQWVDADVEDVINNKQERITSTNKLSIDLIEESSSYKVMTSQEREKLSGIDNKADKMPIESTIPSGGMLPNVFYNLGTLNDNLVVDLAEPTDSTHVNEYILRFTMPQNTVTVSLPLDVTFNSQPNFVADKTYEINIIDDYGLCMEF